MDTTLYGEEQCAPIALGRLGIYKAVKYNANKLLLAHWGRYCITNEQSYITLTKKSTYLVSLLSEI